MNEKKKEYIITYRSEEHYEVLGWVRALSVEEAKEKAQKDLLEIAKYYKITEAEIAEWKKGGSIHFNIF